MLKTKPIKSERKPDDGLRISVMSRHTLSDGVTPDPEIKPGLFDEWWKELGPPADLIGSYYRRGLAWKDFEERYNTFLRQETAEIRVRQLVDLALETQVTILCIEDEPSHCHRRLIAEECQTIEPELEIVLL